MMGLSDGPAEDFFGNNNVAAHVCVAVYLWYKKVSLYVMEHQTTISLMVLL